MASRLETRSLERMGKLLRQSYHHIPDLPSVLKEFLIVPIAAGTQERVSAAELTAQSVTLAMQRNTGRAYHE
jgi:hypothetical protein